MKCVAFVLSLCSLLVSASHIDAATPSLATCGHITPQISELRKHITHSVPFCKYYLSEPRSRTPLPGQSVAQTEESCKCLLLEKRIAIPVPHRFPIPSHIPVAKCDTKTQASIEAEFKYAHAFCRFLTAIPRRLSPMQAFSVSELNAGCKCFDASGSVSSRSSHSAATSLASSSIRRSTGRPATTPSRTRTSTPTTRINTSHAAVSSPVATYSTSFTGKVTVTNSDIAPSESDNATATADGTMTSESHTTIDSIEAGPTTTTTYTTTAITTTTSITNTTPTTLGSTTSASPIPPCSKPGPSSSFSVTISDTVLSNNYSATWTEFYYGATSYANPDSLTVTSFSSTLGPAEAMSSCVSWGMAQQESSNTPHDINLYYYTGDSWYCYFYPDPSNQEAVGLNSLDPGVLCSYGFRQSNFAVAS